MTSKCIFWCGIHSVSAGLEMFCSTFTSKWHSWGALFQFCSHFFWPLKDAIPLLHSRCPSLVHHTPTTRTSISQFINASLVFSSVYNFYWFLCLCFSFTIKISLITPISLNTFTTTILKVCVWLTPTLSSQACFYHLFVSWHDCNSWLNVWHCLWKILAAMDEFPSFWRVSALALAGGLSGAEDSCRREAALRLASPLLGLSCPGVPPESHSSLASHQGYESPWQWGCRSSAWVLMVFHWLS